MDLYALGIGHNTPVFIDLDESCGHRIAGLYHINNTHISDRVISSPMHHGLSNY